MANAKCPGSIFPRHVPVNAFNKTYELCWQAGNLSIGKIPEDSDKKVWETSRSVVPRWILRLVLTAATHKCRAHLRLGQKLFR